MLFHSKSLLFVRFLLKIMFPSSLLFYLGQSHEPCVYFCISEGIVVPEVPPSSCLPKTGCWPHFLLFFSKQWIKKVSLISMSPCQKCDAPVLVFWAVRIFLDKYLSLSNCCHRPSVFSRFQSHLPNGALFIASRSMIPNPPYSLGEQTTHHWTKWTSGTF